MNSTDGDFSGASPHKQLSPHVWCFPSSQTEWRDLGQFLSSLGSLCSPLRFTPTGLLIGHTAPTLASHWSRLASLEMLVFGTLLIKLGSGECNRSRAPCFETFPYSQSEDWVGPPDQSEAGLVPHPWVFHVCRPVTQSVWSSADIKHNLVQ